MKWHLFALALIQSSQALASSDPWVTLRGRGYTDACEYYSRTESDFEVLYQDESLAWGSRVFVILGWGDADADWQDRAELEATAAGPYVWKVELSKTLHFRSSPKRLRSLQFVVRAVRPDGTESYFRGSEALMGFMSAEFPFVGSSPCLSRESKKPEMARLTLKPVDRS